MRFTKLITNTLRAEPSEAESPSHRFMLKAGMISQIASGIYAYMPLAWRSLRKIEAIIRHEMDAIGSQEIRMPVLQPIEYWEESGRRDLFGDNLFTLLDRRKRSLVMAPTHEEIISHLAKTYVRSYRDLPQILYQIQTKFRDEPRPRAGLIRVREFDMKDAYSLDVDEGGLDTSYKSMEAAYTNIYRRCGLPVIMIEADSGAIGGKDSNEFMLLAPSGEDTVITCSKCDYSANLEKAKGVKPNVTIEEPLAVEEISTPNITSINSLAKLFGISESGTLKTVFYMDGDQLLMVTIRGDLDLNETKLRNYVNGRELRLAAKKEILACGLIPGFASPVGISGVRSIGDDSVLLGSNFVAGANKPDKHLKNVNYERDFLLDEIGEFAQVNPGQQCSRCDGVLEAIKGIEVGHIFKLGTVFSKALGVSYANREGEQSPVFMGCYGIGVGRLLAAAIEQNHDERGIAFPMPISPYQVHLIGLNLQDPSVLKEVENLYDSLWDDGIECLYDDREDVSTGVKFNDADLIGIPVRMLISKRSLSEGLVEVKHRSKKDSEMISLNDVLPRVKKMILELLDHRQT
jgi:prolyl-tRNA synthetase